MELGSLAQSLHKLKESFLWAALRQGREDDCLSLLEYGADPNWPDAEGDVPLHAACVVGNPIIVQALLRHGALLDSIGSDGSTALHVAALQNASRCCEILLDAGCDPTIKDAQDRTALQIAQENGFFQLASCIHTSAYRRAAQEQKDSVLPIDNATADRNPGLAQGLCLISRAKLTNPLQNDHACFLRSLRAGWYQLPLLYLRCAQSMHDKAVSHGVHMVSEMGLGWQALECLRIERLRKIVSRGTMRTTMQH
jgi:hypothetical protein